MFLRAAPFLMVVAVLSVGSTALKCFAQTQQSAAPVRFHLGDEPNGNLHWADPDLDDSAWPVAPDGLVPSRSRDADHFLWVRMRVPVPVDLNGPMALHLDNLGVQPMAWQVFVNGRSLGGQGAFPPSANPAVLPVSPVIPLPDSLVRPGSIAVIGIREWHAPVFAESRVPSHPVATIDEAEILRLDVRATDAEAIVTNGPTYALSLLLALAGIALLLFWRIAGGREYLWAAIMLLTPLAMAVLSAPPVTARLSYHASTLAWAILYAAGLIAEIEFMWALFQLRTHWLRVLWHSIWIAFLVADVSQSFLLQSAASQRVYQFMIDAGIPAFDCILFPVCIREMLRPGGNRAIAAAQSIFEVIVALGIFGYSVHVSVGLFPLDLWNLGIMLVDLAIAAMLFRRAWTAWKDSSSLRVEFEAARAVQQQLVVPAVDLPGFQIESAYSPARQVGGDFFRIQPGQAGAVLIVVGDVSGKGLKAAMTVSVIMGALQDYSPGSPRDVLIHLNRVLYGRVDGFVTCCAAVIAADGAMTLANAGNPPPYRNGEEMLVEPGLPLGMISELDYQETRYQIFPGDRLTFVSDGVIEATNSQGELYGFERTRAISTRSANQIAEAAERFGQEDDISVLTVARTAARA